MMYVKPHGVMVDRTHPQFSMILLAHRLMNYGDEHLGTYQGCIHPCCLKITSISTWDMAKVSHQRLIIQECCDQEIKGELRTQLHYKDIMLIILLGLCHLGAPEALCFPVVCLSMPL